MSTTDKIIVACVALVALLILVTVIILVHRRNTEVHLATAAIAAERNMESWGHTSDFNVRNITFDAAIRDAADENRIFIPPICYVEARNSQEDDEEDDGNQSSVKLLNK